MPSYLTPEGICTGLMDDLLVVWIMEYRNDIGDAPAGSKLLIEAAMLGIQHDGAALKQAGFETISQDGLKFKGLDAYQTHLLSLRAMFAKAALDAAKSKVERPDRE